MCEFDESCGVHGCFLRTRFWMCVQCILHINCNAPVHFSVHDMVYSKHLCVISAAQLHMGKVRRQLVVMLLIRGSTPTLGSVDCIPAHINDTLSPCDDPPLGRPKYRAIPFLTARAITTVCVRDLVDIRPCL